MHRKAQKKHPPVASPSVTLSEAAALRGVSLSTLRRWDFAGKFEARRHPMNRYRLYRRADILKVRTQIEQGAVGTTPDQAQTSRQS